MASAYYVKSDGDLLDATNTTDRALDSAERFARERAVDVTVSDERGRVFAFFCKHGGMRDSTMGELTCCEDERLAVESADR